MFATARSTMLTASLVCTFCALLAAGGAAAGDATHEGNFGLTASLQGSQGDIELPYWMSESTVITPALLIQNVSDHLRSESLPPNL